MPKRSSADKSKGDWGGPRLTGGSRPTGQRRRYDFSAESARTNAELSDEIAIHTTLSKEDLDKMVPRRADRQRLQKLITIVKASASARQKQAMLQAEFSDLAPVIVKVLNKLV